MTQLGRLLLAFCIVLFSFTAATLARQGSAPDEPNGTNSTQNEDGKNSDQEHAGKESTLAEGKGRDLVLTRCSVCHEPERVTRAYRDEQGWADLVANMVSRGAELTPEEAKTVVAYLFEHYGIH